MPSRNILFLLLASFYFLQGCVQHPQILYFRNQSEFVPLTDHEINNQIRIRIQPDDVLSILVRSLDQQVAEPFNLFESELLRFAGAQNNSSLNGYLVDPQGFIDIPVLGSLEVGGKTINETKQMLIEKLKPYLTDPVIIIRFMNFRCTVLGEVGRPGQVTIQGERITILEALGQVGDLTPYSNREKILVIREQDGKREFGYVNIHSADIFQSPYFYLQQNDIVYVEPIPAAVATVRDPISEVLPIVSGLLSIVAVSIALATR